MSDADPIETRTYDQLPLATAVSPDALVAVQEPGGALHKLPMNALLGRLIQTVAVAETEADLQLALDYDEHTISLVTADPDPAKCGWYRKDGAPGAGSWLQFEKLSAQAAAEVQPLVDAAAASAAAAALAAGANRFMNGDAPRVSGDIISVVKINGTYVDGSFAGNIATVIDEQINYAFIDLVDVDPAKNVTVVVRPLANGLNAVPKIAPRALNDATIGAVTNAVLQADGTWAATLAPTVAGAEASALRIELDARNQAGDFRGQIYAFEGDAVPPQAETSEAVKAYVAAVTAERPTEARVEEMIDDRAAFIAERVIGSDEFTNAVVAEIEAAAETRLFVNAETGSDANAGTRATPFATIAFGASMTSTLALAMGQVFSAQSEVTVGNTTTGGGLSAYGSGTRVPVIDARTDLSGHVWTAVGGYADVWVTDLTLAQALLPGGTASASTHFAVDRVDDPQADFVGQAYAWKYSGATIADNLAAVSAAAGSFTVHVDGQTAPDPRFGASTSTAIKLYVNAGAGVDPNGLPLKAATSQSVLKMIGGSFRGVKVIGNIWKDAAHAQEKGAGAAAVFPKIADFSAYRSPGHALVGPAEVHGSFTAHARLIDGGNAHYSGGAAWVAYTAVDYSATHDLIANADFDVERHQFGIFVHGSANPFCYRSLFMPEGARFRARGISSAFYVVTVIPDLLTRNVDVEDGDYLITCGNNQTWTHIGGRFAMRAVVGDTRQALVNFLGTGSTVELRDLDFEFNAVTTATNAPSALAMRSGTGTAPLLILDNCRDVTVPRRAGATSFVRHGYLLRATLGGVSASLIRLVIKNATMIGDLMDQSAGTNYPASLYLGPGCTAGMGDRTRAEIRTALAGAGLVEDEDQALAGVAGYYWIDDAATIVGRDGQVLSEAA